MCLCLLLCCEISLNFAGKNNHLEQVLRRVDGAARIVGVDDNNGSRGAVSQCTHAGKVGFPAAARLEVIEPRLSAGDLTSCFIRREAWSWQKNVRPWSATEHCGDRSDGARAANRHEHVGVVGAVARTGGQVIGDRTIVGSAQTGYPFSISP